MCLYSGVHGDQGAGYRPVDGAVPFFTRLKYLRYCWVLVSGWVYGIFD